MKLVATLLSTAMFSLAACASPPAPEPQPEPEPPPPPMVGGPCRYDFKEAEATVTRVFEDNAELIDEDGDTFYKLLDEFDPPAEVGRRYKVEKRFITQGTCTPYGFGTLVPVTETGSEGGQ